MFLGASGLLFTAIAEGLARDKRSTGIPTSETQTAAKANVCQEPVPSGTKEHHRGAVGSCGSGTMLLLPCQSNSAVSSMTS